MLDPSLCAEGTTTSYWTAFSFWMFEKLSTPGLIIPLILTLLGLPWLIKPLPWKRQLSGLIALLLLTYLLIASPIVIALGNRLLVSFLPSDSGASADAIVVLGRGPDLRGERVKVAAELWQAKRAPMIFTSGRGDAEEIAQALEANGLPAQAIDGEPCSLTTEENARFTAAILQPRNARRILLVTDPPHMLRSLLTFRGVGFQVIPHSSPFPPSLNARRKAFFVFREYIGLVSYGLKGRLSPREVPLSSPISELTAHPDTAFLYYSPEEALDFT